MLIFSVIFTFFRYNVNYLKNIELLLVQPHVLPPINEENSVKANEEFRYFGQHGQYGGLTIAGRNSNRGKKESL